MTNRTSKRNGSQWLALACIVVMSWSAAPPTASAQSCDQLPGWPLGAWRSAPSGLDFSSPVSLITADTGETEAGATVTFLLPLVPGQAYLIEYASPAGAVWTEAGMLDPAGCTMTWQFGWNTLGRTWTADGTAPTEWIRGDVNQDGLVDIADPILLLFLLYPPPVPVDASRTCIAMFDANDDGGFNIADAIMILNVLFSGETMPAPYPNCGPDPTFPDPTYCPAYWNCP